MSSEEDWAMATGVYEIADSAENRKKSSKRKTNEIYNHTM